VKLFNNGTESDILPSAELRYLPLFASIFPETFAFLSSLSVMSFSVSLVLLLQSMGKQEKASHARVNHIRGKVWSPKPFECS
jgi:hypothetical protein